MIGWDVLSLVRRIALTCRETRVKSTPEMLVVVLAFTYRRKNAQLPNTPRAADAQKTLAMVNSAFPGMTLQTQCSHL
jgi:hypothetical protein